jgi:hypothetical protein
MAYEVYHGRDNEIAIILKENGTAIDVSGSSAMTLRVGKLLISSTNGSTQRIRWNGTTYVTGEVHLCLGSATDIPVHVYRAPIIVYDSTNTKGVMFGNVHIDVHADPEAT